MEEQLVGFEVAKLAKQKGFKIPCQNKFHEDVNGNYIEAGFISYVNDHIAEVYNRPTQSLLQKWLREKHKIHINLFVNSDNEGSDPIIWKYNYVYGYDNSLKHDSFMCSNDKHFNIYEEALEEGLYEGLMSL